MNFTMATITVMKSKSRAKNKIVLRSLVDLFTRWKIKQQNLFYELNLMLNGTINELKSKVRLQPFPPTAIGMVSTW